MHMVFEGKHAVKLQAKDVEVRTSSDRNPRQDQVTMGRACSPGSTNDYSLSFARIQCHAAVIAPLLNPSQVLLSEAAKVGLSAGLQTTACSVESSAWTKSQFSTSSRGPLLM